MRGSGYEVLWLLKNKQNGGKANSYGSDVRLNKEAKSQKDCMLKQKENGKMIQKFILTVFWLSVIVKRKFFLVGASSMLWTGQWISESVSQWVRDVCMSHQSDRIYYKQPIKFLVLKVNGMWEDSIPILNGHIYSTISSFSMGYAEDFSYGRDEPWGLRQCVSLLRCM